MKPKVSFLIGSGFSIPEGIPGVKQLNARLAKINESEILIHTDQRAFFIEKVSDDPNRWSNWDQRIFLQEFLEFYSAEILDSAENFHYETFYDFYSGYLHEGENKARIEEFYQKFNDKHFNGADDNRDCYNRITDFNRSFSQLLASKLHKLNYFQDISTLNYPPYDGFIGFLTEIIKTHDVKFHTLNHDLFFDWLGQHHTSLWQHFSDGYQLEGSPFYGLVTYNFNANTDREVRKAYYVKLERFVGKFDTSLALFKLHGSIFNTIAHESKGENFRLKANYGVHQIFMERANQQTGDIELEHLLDEVSPDYLSGTTNKLRYYSSDSYYEKLFRHFEKNLETCDFLIVIGYGFKDSGINRFLEKHFIPRGKKMVVIDPSKPDSTLLNHNTHYVAKGVTQLSYKEYMSLFTSLLNNSPINI